jgi:hypothetical protein
MGLRILACFAFGAVALVSGGCLAATVGAVGAAGAGYAYYQGNITRDYQATYDDTRSAVYASLAEMRLPIVGEERIGNSGSVDGLTGIGDKVHVSIETLPAIVPADGPRTRVGVRVGTFGDRILSDRIQHQLASHLTAGPSAAPPPPMSAWGPPQGPPQTVNPAAHTPQTTEPPLSTSRPAP